MRVPLVPVFPATLKVVQFSVEALNGVVGPTPPLIGLNGWPVWFGMAKQLVQAEPRFAAKPPG